MVDLQQQLAQLSHSLSRIETNQEALNERLNNIEKSIIKVEGAWWVARYVIGPMIVLILGGVYALDELISRHIMGK